MGDGSDSDATIVMPCMCPACARRREAMAAAAAHGVIRVHFAEKTTVAENCSERVTALIVIGEAEKLHAIATGPSDADALFAALHKAGFL